MYPPQQHGRDAEVRARDYLQQHGLEFLTGNFRCRRGEIDLIMRDRDILVFVEVRYRRRDGYGSGAESVDRHKQRRIACCALEFLQQQPRLARLTCRFDVVCIGNDTREIDWIPNAFDA